jgi:uncharacterized protein (DUF1810 family)
MDSHQMWFAFPQTAGLGSSQTAALYAIRGVVEARAYLARPGARPRLIECATAVAGSYAASASQLFGSSCVIR